MSKKLTKKQVEFLEKLRNDTELNGRGLLRMFIIRNTYQPKYKVGDFVKITDDTYSYIWGCRIVNVKAKIVEIDWWVRDKGKEYVQYECELFDQFGKKHTIYAEESVHGYYEKRHITGRCKDNQNTFEKKSEYSDSCSL